MRWIANLSDLWKVDEPVGMSTFYKLAGVIVLLWFISLVIMWLVGGNLESRGQAGDQFGAINALFTGLAFAGLITTLLLQRQELELQRRELEMTRNELAGSKEHLKAQSESLQKQNFETTFFEMVRLHHSIVDSIKMGNATSRACFKALHTSFKNEISSNPAKYNVEGGMETLSREKFKKYGDHFGHYFRNLRA
jgi:hypothetical protein